MKKRFFNVTVGGYYVVSMILGIAMAMTIGMIVMDAWSYALDLSYAEDSLVALKNGYGWHAWLDEAWLYLPMTGFYGMLYGSETLGNRMNYAPMVLMFSAVVVVYLSVMIMEGKSANKAWRQKIHQAYGWGMLIFLLDLAFWYAERRVYGLIPAGVVLVPVMLLVIPFLILKKTKVYKTVEQKGEITTLGLAEGK